MIANRNQQVEEIFAAVAGLSPEDRMLELRRRCGGNAELRQEVEALCRCEREAPGFLELGSLATEQLDAFADFSAPRAHPKQIGKFEILGVLGSGGMGIVYRARSESPRREVALKVIRSGPAAQGGAMLRRFEYEAEVLARLKHPGIAQIYEVGTADTGQGPQPYFAMELVEGAGVVEHAKRHSLDVREKVELLAKVCDAILHAHQNGVVHRDLKPINVLVDESGQPKVLDFGVARLLAPDRPGGGGGAAATMHTTAGQLIGTLAYMSPEQIDGDSAHVDGRADVYSMGVMLYELLSGRLPHDVSNVGLSEALRRIREGKPAPVSAEDASLRGDVELIVGKAMRKERESRYQSAAEFGEDLRRYLADRPINARRPSAGYLARKFVKRNQAIVLTAGLALIGVVLGLGGIVWRASVAAGAVAAVSLAAGLVATLWQADRAKKAAARAMIEAGRAASEAARANQSAADALREASRANSESTRAALEQETAEAVSTYLARLLESADPDVGKKREVSVREMLDRSTAESLGREFGGKPRVLAKLHDVIGRSYEQLGLLNEAEGHYRAGLAVTTAQVGVDTLDHVSLLNDLGHLLKLRDAFDTSETMLQEAVDRAERVLGSDHRLTIGCKINLASVLHRREKYAQVERVLRETTASAERTFGPLDRMTHVSMNNLASALREQGNLNGAIVIRRQFLDLARRAFGNENSATLMAMNNLAMDLLDAGDPAAAEALLRETVDARVGLLGPDHRSTINSQSNLAACLRALGRLEEAAGIMRGVMERACASIEPGNIDRAKFELEYGRVLMSLGKHEEAERHMAAAHAAYAGALGESGKRTRQAARELWALHAARGDEQGARTWQERSGK